MTDFPGEIYSPRTKENKSGVVYDEGKKTITFAEDVTKLDDEVVAIETKLGITDAVINKCGGIKPDSDSVQAIQLQNAAGELILNVDTTNKKVGINIETPLEALHVGGVLRIEGGYNSQLDFYEAAALGGRIYWDKDTTQLIIYNAKSSALDAIKIADSLYIDGQLTINSDRLRIITNFSPATAGADGTQGDICWNSNYLYVCVATNTWKRVELSTWA